MIPAQPWVVIVSLLLFGGFVFYFLNRHGLISLLWLSAWILGAFGLGGLVFDRGGLIFSSGMVPAVLLIGSIVSAIGAGVLEYLKRINEKAGPR